jgi:hypothetical protein
MNRKAFLKGALGCAAGCMASPFCSGPLQAAPGQPGAPPSAHEAAFLRSWLNQFVQREESQLERGTLIKLLEERGRACCLALDFRQKLVKDSQGSVEKLIELLGKIVGPENATRQGNDVILIYPVAKCGCGWNPQTAPAPDDPYCDCSKANNQRLFEIVGGKPVKVEVTESPRRGGSHCRFVIHLA